MAGLGHPHSHMHPTTGRRTQSHSCGKGLQWHPYDMLPLSMKTHLHHSTQQHSYDTRTDWGRQES